MTPPTDPQPDDQQPTRTRRRPTWWVWGAVAACAAVVAAAMLTSEPQRVRLRTPRVGQAEGAASAGFDAAKNSLNDLPSAVSLELRPPTVILDSRFSRDGEDVLATITAPEGMEEGPRNIVTIISDNANLIDLGVKSGDIVKMYIFPDAETRLRMRETGQSQTARREATDLVVAQVLDARTLQIQGELRVPVELLQAIPEFGREGVARYYSLGLVNEYGVRLPSSFPLEALGGVQWPPRIEIWRELDERTTEIRRMLAGYANTGEPPLGWEPSPDADELERIVERLNLWIQSQGDPPPMTPPGLVDSLPEDLRGDPLLTEQLSPDALRRPSFDPHEGRLLQEAVWHRDVARWASGDQFDPLPRARRLFDWTVRNVTLTDSPRVLTHRPWETLLYGQGTAAQRAWVFAQLCRQQKIPCYVLQLDRGGEDPWLWCGVLVDGQLRLFDPKLGLEIGSGDSVATLVEVIEDDALLRAYDLPDAPYPVTADQARSATACVVAEPLALTWRARQVEQELSGDASLVLAVDADAEAERLEGVDGVDSVALWPRPWANLRRQLVLAAAETPLAQKTRSAAALDFRPFAYVPMLWKARALHFRGVLETEREARERDVLSDPVNDHRQAAQLYLDQKVRPADRDLEAAVRSEDRLSVYRRSKADATYWLALLKYDEGDFAGARRWLERDTLDAPYAEHRADGVRYNLARAYEALGERRAAAELLEGDDSPQRHGALVRAARLREAAGAADTP